MAQRCFLLAMVMLAVGLGKASCQVAPNLDSLERVCHAYPGEDSVKVKMLIEMSSQYRISNQTKGLEAAEQALSISQKKNLPIFVAESHRVKGLNLFNMGQYQAGVEELEQALELSRPLGNQKQLAGVLLNLGNVYHYTYNHAQDMKVLQEALTLFERQQDKMNMATCLNFLGLTKIRQSDNLGALEDFNKVLTICKAMNNLDGIANCYNNLGIVYTNMAKYDLAMDQYQLGLTLSEKTNDAVNMARIYTNLAGIHYRLGDINQSLDYDRKALEIYQILGDNWSIGMTDINLASKYFSIADYDKSIAYNQKGIRILEPLQAFDYIAIGYSNLGVNYMSKQDFGKALVFLDTALVYFRNLGNDAEIARILLNKGMIILSAPDSVLLKFDVNPALRYDEAETAFLESSGLAKKTNSTVYQVEASRQLSTVYELKGNYQKALEAFNDYMVLKDSIAGEDIRQQITRKEIQFEFDKKKATFQLEEKLIREQLEKQQLLSLRQQQTLEFQKQGLELADQEKELQQLALLQEKAKIQEKEQQLVQAEEAKKLQSAQLNQLSLEKEIQQQNLEKKSIYIGLLLATLISAFLTGLTWLLWQRQKKIKKDILLQQHFTQQLFENTEEERSRIARDLHDGISHELLTLKRDFVREADKLKASAKIEQIINDIRMISRNLHPVMLESIGLKIGLETLCEQFMQSDNLFISYDIDYTTALPKLTELQIFRIVQESLTNTLKYANANAGKITISMQSGKLLLKIQDNGKGFDVKKVMQSGNAFGLNSIYQRSKGIGGTANIHSSPTGTIIQVEIPIPTIIHKGNELSN